MSCTCRFVFLLLLPLVVFLVVLLPGRSLPKSGAVDMEFHVDGAGTSSAAKRRRERRLRAAWRHEQLSVRMALAAAQHHSAPKCAGPETHEAPRGQTTARAAAGAQLFCLDLDEALAAGRSRPDRLTEVRPQERVQRHSVEQMADGAPVLPMLDAPVPLVVEQPVKVLKILNNSLTDVEQVIEVPKIILHQVPQRAVPREPRMAEQLVEVPVLSVSEVTIMAPFVDTAGRTWYWISTGRMGGTRAGWRVPSHHPADPPGGDHRQPRAVYKYWARMRIFYGPLYLAVTCSVLVCLRSTCVDFSPGDDFWIYFRVQRFSVRQWIHVAASLRRREYCFRTTAQCLSSVVHVIRPALRNFLFFYVIYVDYGS